MRTILSNGLLSMIVTVSVFSATAHAQKASPRITALRKIGLAPFSVKGRITSAQAEALTKQLANDMTAMSYIQAVPVAGSVVKSARAELLKTVTTSGLDGVIIAEVSPEKVSGLLLSRTGESLAPFALSRDVALGSDAQIKVISRAIVDEVARAIPYRGYITGRTKEGFYEINLGKNQGILKGQRFRVFDFATPSFASERIDKGEVKVVEASDSTALVEPTGDEVQPYDKIGFNDQAHGMVAATQVETRGFAYVGGGLLNVSGTGDPKYLDQAYNISSAAAFKIGGGWKDFAVDLLFAQANGDQTGLTYIEVIGNDQVYEQSFGGINRFSVLVGGRVASVGISTKRGIVSPLASTTSISPEFEARLDRIIKGPVRGFVSASAYFPIYVTGIDTSAVIFSYGIGGDAGLSLDLSQRMFLDVEGRYHLIRRPVQGQTAVNETYTEFFADLGYRF